MTDIPPPQNDKTESITDALANLSDRIRRFTQAGSNQVSPWFDTVAMPPTHQPSPEKQVGRRCRPPDYISTLIMERDEAFFLEVASKYAQYRDPFKTLGEDSKAARRIASDERYLLDAYNLFKAAKKAESEIGKGTTFIKDTNIASPLASRAEYTTGEELVYLRAYLMFEQKITDYAPQFEQYKDGFVLTFVPLCAVRETFKTKEILAAIKAAYREDT